MSTTQFDALPMLYEQHRLYTDELGNTHAGLGKLYRKLTKVERKLKEKHESDIPRNQMKKLWWTRQVTKQSIEQLETKKNELYARLQQCRDLITSYHHDAYMASSPAFWTTYFPPTPFMMSPFTPFSPAPWSVQQPCHMMLQQQPQYWDLSMLNEHGEAMTDSAYHGSEVSSQVHGSDHVYAHEMLSTPSCSAAGASIVSGTESEDCGQSAEPLKAPPSSIDTVKANEDAKHRYSETVVNQKAQTSDVGKQ